jgi:hypothetical protein
MSSDWLSNTKNQHFLKWEWTTLCFQASALWSVITFRLKTFCEVVISLHYTYWNGIVLLQASVVSEVSLWDPFQG